MHAIIDLIRDEHDLVEVVIRARLWGSDLRARGFRAELDAKPGKVRSREWRVNWLRVFERHIVG
jgi:hypothetical protein